MLRYFFAEFVPSDEGGFEPRLPDNYGFLLLADSGQGSEWGIFDISLVDTDSLCEGLSPVDDVLQNLISCAMSYSPALAIARDETGKKFADRRASRGDFAAFYGDSIRRELEAQDTSGFLLARAVHDEPGYLLKGGYYWIVEYIHESREVYWVSADFHLYRNPASHFDVPRYRLMPLGRLRLDRTRIADQLDAVPSIQHVGEIKANELQGQIDQVVSATAAPMSIRLGHGSEDTDLTYVVDVRAEWEGCRARRFTVASQKWIDALFEHPAEIGPPDIYAVGGPLIIVKEINGAAVVRAVLRHIQLEDH